MRRLCATMVLSSDFKTQKAWIDKRQARAPLFIIVQSLHGLRLRFSMLFDFGQKEWRISKDWTSIWVDRRRARAHLSVSDKHFDRQASSESAFQYSGNAFGSTAVDREHCCARRELICIALVNRVAAPFRLTKQVLLAFH